MGDISVDYLVGKLNNTMENLSHTKAVSKSKQKDYIIRYLNEVEHRSVSADSIHLIGKWKDITIFKFIDPYDNSTMYIEVFSKDGYIYVETFENLDGEKYDLSV